MRPLLLVVAVAFSAHADTSSASPTDEKVARALVQAWVEAQNRGDLAAYRALYSQSFRGIRRSAERRVELDRDGWLRERERMFRHPMTVAISGLRFTRPGASLRASLVQEFRSGSYADRGPKELDLVNEAGAMRIAREELLSSEKLSSEKVSSAKVSSEKVSSAKAAAATSEECPAVSPAPFAGSFRGEPGWLVLGETGRDHDSIMRRALSLEEAGIEAHPIATSLFAGLRPGLFAIVHGGYPTRELAEQAATALRARAIKPYVKQSGNRSGRLVEIRGITQHNQRLERLDVQVVVPVPNSYQGPERDQLVSDSNGRFVWWTDATGPLWFAARAEPSEQENSKSAGTACVTLPEAGGKIDLGTLDATTWFCGN